MFEVRMVALSILFILNSYVIFLFIQELKKEKCVVAKIFLNQKTVMGAFVLIFAGSLFLIAGMSLMIFGMKDFSIVFLDSVVLFWISGFYILKIVAGRCR